MPALVMLGLSITLLVLLSICTVLFLSWRKKSAQHKYLEQFLEDIDVQQSSRKNQLTRQLGNKFKLSKSDADQLGEQLVKAEKRFLQHYIAQLLQHSPSDHLYSELVELLDLYVDKLSPQLQSEESPVAEEANAPTKSAESNASEVAEPTPEPEWGDVFD